VSNTLVGSTCQNCPNMLYFVHLFLPLFRLKFELPWISDSRASFEYIVEIPASSIDCNVLITSFVAKKYEGEFLADSTVVMDKLYFFRRFINFPLKSRENSTLTNPLKTRISLNYMYFRIQFITLHKQITASPWTAWPTKMGSIRCPEMSVNNY